MARRVQVEMGIPQGSVLGPYLWAILFDGLLRRFEEVGHSAIAYVDDLVVIIPAETKASIENTGALAVTELQKWCRECKLETAPEKTQLMLLKGKLRIRSPPVVRLLGETIKATQVVTYLGIRIGAGMRFGDNAQHTRQ